MREILKLHPRSHRPGAANVEVEIRRPCDGVLALNYVVCGRMADLILPQVVASARVDELWRRTCFEAFVGSVTGPGYYEFNFAPSTAWAAYRFDAYRSGMGLASEIVAPRIEIHASEERCEVRVSLDLGSSPILTRDGAWRVGLSAVIVDRDGNRSYWALAHPPGKPDFHHSDGFVRVLIPERSS